MSFKKSLRNILDKMSRINAQATLEYLILFSVIALLTAITVAKSGILQKTKESGEKAVDTAITKMSDIASWAPFWTPPVDEDEDE